MQARNSNFFSSILDRVPGAGLVALAAVFSFVACDDNGVAPGTAPNSVVDQSQVTFDDTDPVLGSIEMPRVALSNSGVETLEVESIEIEGPNASDFSIVEGGDAPFSLSSSDARTIVLSFVPTGEGSKTAELVIRSNDADMPEETVSLSGQAVRFQYSQVDRKGIPALNTVFNHPSGTAGFDKVAYNVASPASDVSTYRDQFITVLEAVGNSDPSATADLLLPDELPVALGVTNTAFGDLTGRAPADDATDVALSVTVGPESLKSDNVPANDKAFLNSFPFLATPHE